MSETPETSKLDEIVAASEAGAAVARVYAIVDVRGDIVHYGYIDVFAGDDQAKLVERAYEEYQEYVMNGYDMATESHKAYALLQDAQSVRLGESLTAEQFEKAPYKPARPDVDGLSEPIEIDKSRTYDPFDYGI